MFLFYKYNGKFLKVLIKGKRVKLNAPKFIQKYNRSRACIAKK
jgi:hypothetical protein